MRFVEVNAGGLSARVAIPVPTGTREGVEMNPWFSHSSYACKTSSLALATLALFCGAGRSASAALNDAVAIAAATCDDTCSNGKVGDANPCITSATGTCVPTAGSPAATVCTGCAFAPGTDQTGKVVGCTMSCRGLTNKIEE